MVAKASFDRNLFGRLECANLAKLFRQQFSKKTQQIQNTHFGVFGVLVFVGKIRLVQLRYTLNRFIDLPQRLLVANLVSFAVQLQSNFGMRCPHVQFLFVMSQLQLHCL